MARQWLRYQDIMKDFVILEPYGTLDAYPPRTVALCEITYDYASPVYRVFRNKSEYHAERKLLAFLGNHPAAPTSQRCQVKVYMNYSPCSDCADAIIKYKQENPECDITIYFANFYKHYDEENMKGLRRLAKKVTLGLLGGQEWKELIENENLVYPNYADKITCKRKIRSAKRQEREKHDLQIMNSITDDNELLRVVPIAFKV